MISAFVPKQNSFEPIKRVNKSRLDVMQLNTEAGKRADP
jgi:hypothetical protein